MFEEIHQAVMASYEGHQPLWMASPDQSVFSIMSKQEFEGKSDEEIQEIFRRKHIVIHHQFQPTLSFDERGLRTLGDLFKPVTIHGAWNICIYIHIFNDRLLKGKHI
jgi:hypothetical protein